MHPRAHANDDSTTPRLIAWEVTRTCLLNCRHCRAAASRNVCANELGIEECFKLLDNIASFAKPIIILTGGEPMLRADIYDIAKRARKLGLPTVMAPCGLLLNDETAARIVDAGIRRISLSLDGADAATHDAFRGFVGSFEGVMGGIEAARRCGLDFQINTTISRHNFAQVQAILDLSVRLGASVFNPFLLVPTGRGRDLMDQELTAGQYEQTLRWLAAQQGRKDIQIRVTCAPHYQRILRQCGGAAVEHASKGCMGGKGFAFISHVGKVQICGFLETECGDVRAENYDFRRIWETSKVFLQMRDVDSYHGRCGYCEFRKVCGGCRARAHALTGDYLAEEPFCIYQPKRLPAENASQAPLGELDKKILTAIQSDFPLALWPYDLLGERLGLGAADLLVHVRRLVRDGYIRRLGAVFDARGLGYCSTLVAARIPPDRLAEVAAMVSELPGVTHNYGRQNAYNLWFTLTTRNEAQRQAVLEDLRRRSGLDEFHSLPALAMYKSRVQFWQETEVSPAPAAPQGPPQELDEWQKDLVRVLQASLPLVEDPFSLLAGRLGIDVSLVLRQAGEWLASGVIRRIGAVVFHRRLGFKANGMAVFNVPLDQIDAMGQKLSEHSMVSHCYHRPLMPDWQYDLFAMIHGQNEDEVRRFVERAAGELNLKDYDILFSTAEYKKISMEYFVESP